MIKIDFPLIRIITENFYFKINLRVKSDCFSIRENEKGD